MRAEAEAVRIMVLEVPLEQVEEVEEGMEIEQGGP